MADKGKKQKINIYEEDIVDRPLLNEENQPSEMSVDEDAIDVNEILSGAVGPLRKDTQDVVTDPGSLLSINVKQGSPLQRTLEDPTINDPLCLAIRDEDSAATVLNSVMGEIAEELAYLKQWKRENYNLKDDFSDISLKRVQMLKEMVKSLVEKEKLKNSRSSGKVDFHSEGFKNVFRYFLQVVQDTFTKVNIPKQFNDIFFTQLAKDLDNFEKKAEKIYNGKASQ